MTPGRFDELSERVAPFLCQKRVYRSAIRSNGIILESLITLRCLAVGASQSCLSLTFRTAPCTVHCVLLEMCTATWNALNEPFLSHRKVVTNGS